MRIASNVHRHCESKTAKFRRSANLLLIGAGLLLTTPGAAQRAGETSSVADVAGRPCNVFAVKGTEGRPQELRAKCKDRGLALGRVTAFEAIFSEQSQATLIDAHLGDQRRVLLVTVRNDGTPLAEDLTGQIARAAGRGPMSDIAGIELDLKQFAKTGEIGLRGRPEDRARAKADRIAVGEQIVRERERRGDRTVQN